VVTMATIHRYAGLVDVDSPHDKQIKKDISRTFPEMSFFQEKSMRSRGQCILDSVVCIEVGATKIPFRSFPERNVWDLFFFPRWKQLYRDFLLSKTFYGF
jgi:hypothetical protein